MNGIHDLGGMHGFGAVPKDDATFHADWERIVFAVSLLYGLAVDVKLDEKRFAIEQLDPEDYLRLPYFGRWLLANEALCVEKGLLEAEEIDQRLAEIKSGEYELPERQNTELARRARELFEADRFSKVENGPEPSFELGDEVVVKNRHPKGHYRAPQYTRRAKGVVCKHHGIFPLADAAARGEEVPEPVYSVEFTHRELWGPDHSETDRLRIDMWESYIEPADESA